ncbi:hypothetical protein [Algibacter sp. 2305UL17-15]|uniref:hypothetical protein n=1 Tax=Algibacter sp. 2305UL17-15 TaxID=3231268 RepID=UPI003459F2C2
MQSINEGDVLGASLAVSGLFVDVAGLSTIKGAIKGVKIFRKGLRIYRKLRGVLGGLRRATQRGFKVTFDNLGGLIIEKGGKVIARSDDKVKKLLKALEKTLDAIYDTQRAVIDKYKGATVKGASRNAKGVFGEVATDVKFAENGFEALHIRKGQNGDLLDGWGDSGIDHVFKKDGKFYIVESKYGTASLGNTLDGRQMSEEWISAGNFQRLRETVGNNITNEMIAEGYVRVISKVAEDGTTLLKRLDEFGNEIGIFVFN